MSSFLSTNQSLSHHGAVDERFHRSKFNPVFLVGCHEGCRTEEGEVCLVIHLLSMWNVKSCVGLAMQPDLVLSQTLLET